jgi:cytochrome c nitrite reductase small subunit
MTSATFVLVTSCVIGVAAGLGGFTFVYAKGASYLTDNPNACANCHVMNEQLDGWTKSSHRAVAVCNDCHTPHDFIGKYATKARNGFWHSFYFTSGTFPEPIQITPPSLAVTEQTCRDCHGDIAEAIDGPHRGDRDSACTRCHRGVGHAK